MHPYVAVLRLGGVERPFGSYGVMVVLGVLVASVTVVRAAARSRADVGMTVAGLAVTVFAAFAGAFGLFVLVELARTGSFASLAGGGVVFFGAVPGALFGAGLAARWFRTPSLSLIDLSIPGVAAGHALGRLGCFLGGCCYGAPARGWWAVAYPHETLTRHPAPVYEALGLSLLALGFALVPARRPGTGRRALAYLGAYAALRLVVELFRGDPERGLLAGISTSQAIAVALILAVVTLWRSPPRVIGRWLSATPGRWQAPGSGSR